ncbi:MAG: hypothetical protein FWC60_10140 [Firmicutes bacterium]|nr:hypothetical protein [Bacillota bacterium]
MNKFIALVQVNLIAALRQMSFARRRADKIGWAFASVFVLIVLFLMAYCGLIAYTVTKALHPVHLEWFVLAILFMLVSLFVFTTNLYTTNAVLFESSDTEQLFAYPLPKYQILFAKISGLVLENWLVSLVFALPFVCVYGYFVHPFWVFYVYALLCTLSMPLIPLSLIALVSYIVSALTSGTQFKNYLNIILTIALAAGIVTGINTAIRHFQVSAVPSANALLEAFKTYYPPMGYAVAGLYHQSATEILMALLWNVAPFVLLCAVLSMFYAPLRSRIVVTKKARGGKLSFGSSSKLGAMTKKEFARLFHSPTYILNSCIGILLLTVFAVGAGHAGKSMERLLVSLHSMGADQVQVVLVVFLFILSITNTTAPSISLEGKNLWIVKSCPVQPRTALLAKLLVQSTVFMPLLVIDAVIVFFTMGTGLGGSVTILIACLLFTLLSGLVGLIYNLHFHRFDFYNDMQVVKNSASVLLTMVTMLAVAAASVLLYWLANQFAAVSFYHYAALVMVIFVAVILYLWRYLSTKGVELFRQL